MSVSNTSSLDIELPTLPSPAKLAEPNVPAQASNSSNAPPSSPLCTSPVASSSTNSDHLYPPAPAYTPPLTNEVPSFVLSEPPEAQVDSDLLQYTMAHDHGETAITRRLPEAFPSDLFSLRSNQGVSEPLPPYGANEPPRYTRRIDNMQSEPKTLAMVLYKFGFFFPIFWIFGSLILLTPLLRSYDPSSPLSRRPTWPPDTALMAWYNENVRTEEDMAEFLAKMQEIERKWAKRCLIALGLFTCSAIAIGVAIFGIVRVTG